MKASPRSAYGSVRPAKTPIPAAASRRLLRAGTPASRQLLPKRSSTSEPDPGRTTAGGGVAGAGAAAGVVVLMTGLLGGLDERVGAAAEAASVRGDGGGRAASGRVGSSTRKRAPVSPGSGSTRAIRPPCRSVTHRAMASPSPVPPPPGSGRVPKRSKTRSRSSGAMPGPSSATSSRVASPTGPAQIRTVPPPGLCRAALSSRLASSWCSLRRSACATSPGGSTRTSKETPRASAGVRASATASSTRTASGRSTRSRATTPASTLERSSRSATRSLSRSACPSATRIVSGSGSVTPSSRFSRTATRAVSGVRSSCDTLATSSRRWRSTVSRSAAITLKARASWPTSSVEPVSTRTP